MSPSISSCRKYLIVQLDIPAINIPYSERNGSAHENLVLSYQPRVTVTSCFLYKVIRDRINTQVI